MLTFGVLALLGVFSGPPDVPSIDSAALPSAFVAVASPALRPTLPDGGSPWTREPARVVGARPSSAGSGSSILVAARILQKYQDFRDSLSAP
jgi:hypothetical protein